MLFCLLAAGTPGYAQQLGSQQTVAARQAAQLARQLAPQWAGDAIPAASFRIASAHTEPSGLLYAYSQQLQAGIPVYNRVTTLVFKAGELRHHAGTFVPAKAFVGQPATATVTPSAAVTTALASIGAKNFEGATATSTASGPEQQQTFAPAGAARRPIEVRLVWATDKGTPRLAWNVNVELLATPDWLNIRVDANTGRVLGQDNWTVSEKAAYPAATPGRRPVASASPAHAPQVLRQPSSAKSTLAIASASYRVVPFPGERPDVTTPRVDTNPWLRAGASNPVASYGWHFDGTTNYTDTRGNNVWAYDDSLKLNAPGRFTASTGTSSALVFDDMPDFTQVPTLGKNRRAATTNLFYWNNLMHDVMYQYGFTEASGNFQTDNQGRGGTGGDYVRAEAQDGGGTNNANFATPPDGVGGRMQMYLWNGITPTYTINVTAPAAIAGNYVAVESGFSTNNKLATLGPISGQLALYADANNLACNPASTPLTGKIAVLYRGTCSFAPKVKNAQLAGAIAAIVINNIAGAPIVMGGTDNTVTIPAVMVSQDDGATLVGQIANGVQVTLPKPTPTGPQLDGDFDSGVMSHEYGHGISNRLTGGGTNTSCLNNAEQAGEGWSDYFGLMMTTDWTTAQTTDGPKARPVGAYVYGQTPSGVGLRRYPYSTSLSVNPLTYANVATNPEVHAIGEVWTATLWDMTWNIIQQQGVIEPNLYNSASTGGNAVALNLVMQGLKLQPCQPGFLDSRDAILAADSLLYGGQYHCSIWSAFARRGMGFSAREGAATSATDQTVAYDQPGVTLRKHTTPLVGNQFTITLAASCDCQPTSSVSITDQLPAGLQYVSSSGGTLSGNTVTFSGLNFTKGQQRTFQIVAQAATGAACPIVLPVNDDRETNTVGGFTPAVVTAGGGNAWAPTTALAHSGTTSWAAGDPNAKSDVTLTSAAFTPTGFSLLSFYHFFSTESIYDGGMVAISVNNGAWQDAASYFLQNGYNSVFTTGTASAGKPCFSGISSELSGPAAFQQSVLNLTSFSGQSIRVRFQFQSDEGNPYNGLLGWYIDDIQVLNGCGGLQQVQLLNSANTVTASYAQAILLTDPLTTWTGAVSTDWFTAGNWTGGVPNSAFDAIIPAGAPRYPLLNGGTPTARALTLNTGATITQTDGTLDVRGTWTNNGTFTATGGTVQLGGNAGSQILGSSTTRFWNLTTSGNDVNLSTSAGFNLQRLLLTSTNLNTNGNPVLLESNATGTAMIASPSVGVSLLGTSVTAQRYISPGANPGAGYRHLASPTVSTSNSQGTMFSDLATANFTPLANTAYNTSATPGTTTPFPNIFAYDQTRLASVTNNLSSFDKGWLSPAALSDRMTSGLGYTVNLAASQTVSFKGQPGYGDLVRSLTRNAAGSANATDAGWNLMGNPYPSPYDYSLQAAGDRTNLDAAIYIFESSGQYTGNYRAYTNGVGSGNPVLAMGQAFFTRVSTGQTSGTLVFRNANRVTAYTNPAYLRTAAETRPLVQLTLASTTGSLTDDAYVYFEQGATEGLDPQYDAEKLPNSTGLNLSTSVASHQLAIDGRSPLGTAQRVVSLAVGVPAPGTYSLTSAQLLNLAAVPVYLRDLQTGTVTDLRLTPSYQFTVSNASALITGRFELLFSPQQPLATVPAALAQQVALYPNPAKTSAFLELPASLGRQAVTATLVDALGRVVRTTTLPAQGAVAHSLDLRGLSAGVYALRLNTSAGTVVKRLTVE
ncbi:M36 family metallopeptidase [Hymenobacter cheonanensis]|uniref:M36 family metallopeptidase n=1 Tax=Hymenobacter sp. CA2-7 TaxID=3063993 RepID=UPI0027132609|nr:M36 family metallopeptidase [Hymenobacter sp. CA2-7]MDO7885243.1 M36 family metallopeptidase [Hymenobacter sp. CA2-7]